jgi:DNA polymerase III delta prime subunit
MRFNQLPEINILSFLKKINIYENLNVDENILISIQRHFNSDIRSMINYMQANQHLINDCHVITNSVWENITQMFKLRAKSSTIIDKLNEISIYYNIERKNIIKNYLNYIIRHNTYCVNSKILNFIEHIMHIQECKTEHLLQYFVLKMMTLIGD